MLIAERAGKYELTAFADVEYDAARQLAAHKVAECTDCDAYVLYAAAVLTGTSFQGTIEAFVAEGAERGMEYGYRLFGVPDDGRIVPLYDGHTEQFFRRTGGATNQSRQRTGAAEKRSWFQRLFGRRPGR